MSVLANACGDNPVSPTAVPSANANLAVMLTDAPIDDVEQVNIYFTSVTVKPEGKPVQQLTLELAQKPMRESKLLCEVLQRRRSMLAWDM